MTSNNSRCVGLIGFLCRSASCRAFSCLVSMTISDERSDEFGKTVSSNCVRNIWTEGLLLDDLSRFLRAELIEMESWFHCCSRCRWRDRSRIGVRCSRLTLMLSNVRCSIYERDDTFGIIKNTDTRLCHELNDVYDIYLDDLSHIFIDVHLSDDRLAFSLYVKEKIF
jgi:hypothetical protein